MFLHSENAFFKEEYSKMQYQVEVVESEFKNNSASYGGDNKLQCTMNVQYVYLQVPNMAKDVQCG